MIENIVVVQPYSKETCQTHMVNPKSSASGSAQLRGRTPSETQRDPVLFSGGPQDTVEITKVRRVVLESGLPINMYNPTVQLTRKQLRRLRLRHIVTR